MAINLATKYEKKVAERFALGSLTDKYCNHDYTFNGVKGIIVYSVDTVAMADYTRSGTARFGTLAELGDTKQELTLTKDRAFTFSIDKGNAAQQFNIKQANACLKRQIDEVLTPEIDQYRLAKWVGGNGLSTGKAITKSNDGVLTSANIVEKIFTAAAQLSDDKVPMTNRVMFIPELTFVKFKLASVVMGANGIAAENIRKGYKGTIDGMAVVTVPSSIFPSGYNFIIKHASATVDAMQLKSYRVHKDPMGVDGDVVEGRVIYDSFVLDSRCKGIYASSTTAPTSGG